MDERKRLMDPLRHVQCSRALLKLRKAEKWESWGKYKAEAFPLNEWSVLYVVGYENSEIDFFNVGEWPRYLEA